MFFIHSITKMKLLGIVLVLVFVVTFFQSASPFELGDIYETGCAAVVGTVSTGVCVRDFQNSVKPFLDSDGRLPVPVACCGITTLRYCILDKIKDSCGSTAKSMVDLVLKGVLLTVKVAGDLPCDGDEWYYRKESPLCWPVWGRFASFLS